MDLFRRTESAVGPNRVAILSSGACPGSPDGKRRWLDRHLPGHAKRAIFASEKFYAAAPHKVLVEDFEKQHDQWVSPPVAGLAGGPAILVPRPWNRRRHECKPGGLFCVQTAMAELRDLLGTIGG